LLIKRHVLCLLIKTAFASIQDFSRKGAISNETNTTKQVLNEINGTSQKKTVNRIEQIDVCQDAYHRTKVSEREKQWMI